jgi:abhydrolase domain-containing protein 5
MYCYVICLMDSASAMLLTSLFLSLVCSASEWKVPTTFIYGFDDWMNYKGAQEARKHMKVPCEIIRVPQVSLSPFHRETISIYLKWTNKLNSLLQGGHFVFIENPSGFHSAVFYACRRFLSPDPDSESLPEGLTSA